jgi:outer membrane receptor for ferrienterochelin and colicin
MQFCSKELYFKKEVKLKMTNNSISASMRFLILGVCCFVLSIGHGFAQGPTGQITGVVTDANDAVIPNATVTITNKNNNATQTTTASEDGIYRFVSLQAGNYTVKVSAASFAEQTLEVEVQVGRTTDANFKLGASAVTETVQVTAEGVQTTQSNADAVINEQAIQNLPINGRRFQDFVTLTPSAQVENSRGQISLSGQRGINGNVNVDGVDFNQTFFGGIRGGERSNQAFVIPQESIKEFQVVAAGYTAEFGRSTGGIVNAITKSGTNDLRGSLFYLWRPEQLSRGNEYLDALQEQNLDKVGVEAIPAPTQHQFGGSIGGPIVKDRLFFFGSYEQQKLKRERQVVFANILGLDLVALGRGNEAYNFLKGLEEGYQETNDAYAGLGRIDWNVNDNHRLNGRYNFSKNTAVNAVATGGSTFDPSSNQALSSQGIEGNKNHVFVGQLISNFGSSVVNEMRGQYAREDRPREANTLEPNVFFGTTFGQYGSRNFLPTTQYDTRFQIADSLTWIKGNHTLKFGGEYSRIFATQQFGFDQFGAYSLSTGGTADILRNVSSTREGTYLGRFDVTASGYSRQIGNLQAAFRNQELAFFAQDSWRISPRFTLNYGLRAEQQYNPDPEATNTAIINVVKNTKFPIRGGGFDPTQIPDSGWQFGPRLGAAWDPIGDGKTVLRAYGGIYYARTPGLIFADSVNNYRTTPGNVRTFIEFTGYSTTTANNYIASAAGAQYRQITGCDPVATPGTGLCNPNTIYRQFALIGINLNTFTLDNLPDVTPAQLAQIAGALGLSPNPFVGAQVTGHAEDFKNPRSYQAGFSFEREFGTGFYAGIDYSFVETDRLQRNRDLNVPAPLTGEQYRAFLQANNTAANYNTMVANGTIATILSSGRTYIAQRTPEGAGLSFPSGSTTIQQRPTNNPLLNPNFTFNLGSVQVRESTGRSLYQGVTFRARLVRKWVNVNAYYTLSDNKSDDDNERDSGGVAFANPYDLSNEFWYSRLDRRHQFVANPVFYLPYGIEAASSIRLRSGTPLSTAIGVDANGDNVFNDRPRVALNYELPRNFFRNRNVYDVDVRVQKGFNFDERRRLVISGEFFNVFNLTNLQFQFAGTNSTSGTLLQYCTVPQGQTVSHLCGSNGVPTNINFLQIREQNPTSSNFGKINLSTNPGTQAFQIQLGARFQF